MIKYIKKTSIEKIEPKLHHLNYFLLTQISTIDTCKKSVTLCDFENGKP